jgi:hypothetical protein
MLNKYGETFKNSLKIKLVITETSITNNKKIFREIFSPIATKFDLIPKFGMFHSALMIGPWIFDWYKKK